MNFKFNFFKFFPKKFERLFNSLYKHKLDYNLNKLIKKGLNLEVIYDIGAFKGEWSKNLSKRSLKNKKFYLFEANESNKKFLISSKFEYFIGILSDSNKEVNFYSRGLTGDSYYREKSNRYDQRYKAKVVSATTLDDVVKKNKLKLPHFIKLDTQGSEIDILKGSEETLLNCYLLYLETPIIEYNLNSPNLTYNIKYLNSIGFIPYDICEIHYMDKMLVQIDILYIRKNKFLEIFPYQPTIDLLK